MEIVRRPGPYATPRRFPRFQLGVRLSMRTSSGPDVRLRGRTLEISVCGLSALIPGELEVGTIVELDFALHAEAQDFRVRAVVRNQWGARYGFEFLTPSAEQRQRIDETSKRLEPFDE